MPPASMMTIDSTEAKIGRSMKKLENTELVIPFGRPLPLAASRPQDPIRTQTRQRQGRRQPFNSTASSQCS